MISLDAATVFAQWATGGLLFCWFTTRRRQVGLGYGWMLRGVNLVLALVAIGLGFRFGVVWGREIALIAMAVATAVVLGISIAWRAAGVSGQRAEFDRRSARVAEMTGIERTSRAGSGDVPGGEADDARGGAVGGTTGATGAGVLDGAGAVSVREFPPVLDLIPVAFGVVALVFAGVAAAGEGNVAVALARTLVGAAFLGAITDAMLLGHWYLVQPGLPRKLLNEIVTAVGWVWPAELVVMLLPTGMWAVLSGQIDDGWGGTLGWFWVASSLTTLVLVFVTRAALRERQYSAVMAATGLLYLAILTGFGMDLVARAVLDG